VQKLKAMSVEPAPGTPAQLAARLKEERDGFAQVIKTAGIKFE
jgi:hypothetical protein